MLDIHKIQIQIRKDLFNHLKRSTCHAFKCGVDAPFLGSPEHISCKFRLAEALASGKSKSSSGTAVIGTILLHLSDRLSHSHISSDNLVFSQNLHGLDLVFLGFRIAAPSAAKHTALEKYDGTDPRSVMNRISLDIKNTTFCI